MKENGENMWLKNLPAHTPPEGMWERIETRMDNDLANESLRAQLTGLPEHEAPFGLWARIEQGLARRRAVQFGVIASGIAASLLLAFVLKVLILPEPTNNQPVQAKAKGQIVNPSPGINIGTTNKTGTFAISVQKKQKSDTPREISQTSANLTGTEQSTYTVQYSDKLQDISIPADFSKLQGILSAMLPLKMESVIQSTREVASLSPNVTKTDAAKNITKNDTLTEWLLARSLKDNFPPPPSPAFTNQPKGVSIGFGYFPESMSKSDHGSSAYKTFALVAQYQMPSADFRTGLGISYQSVPLEYKTDYISFSTTSGYVNDTIINNGDTLFGALLDAGAVNISGIEHSSFLYYSIGAGKRIYSNKRISTSLRVGAGVSFLLSNQHNPSGPVYDALKNQSNTIFSNTESNIPDINQTHFDLVTGFDFNYRLHKRWSLSIEPILKYYFNPIYNGSNARSFSTGLRTGILFKL